MLGRLRTSTPVAFKRVGFWLTLALFGNALVWILRYNHVGSLSVDAPQSLFGVPISHDTSMGLVLFELAGMPAFGLLLVTLVLYSLTRNPRRRVAPNGNVFSRPG